MNSDPKETVRADEEDQSRVEDMISEGGPVFPEEPVEQPKEKPPELPPTSVQE